ncbi:hypothetical protein CK203_059068 [Vitis vinifera]|uniref:Uncharacterized protein n=1 Tax=Vitis vinifera TaxID=29760 RepID=A0A438GTR5_VITVI|nr:hypothetical protein CK203_059068 [Vitis vinifera]
MWSHANGHFCKVEAQLIFLKKESQNYTSRCATEAKKLVEDVEIETHNVDIVEREVADVLETSKLKLQEAIKQNEEEIQMCAWELYALVDSVSKYKEHMASKISEMKCNLSETAGATALDKGKNLEQMVDGVLSAEDVNHGSEFVESVASQMNELTVTPPSESIECLNPGGAAPDIDKESEH